MLFHCLDPFSGPLQMSNWIHSEVSPCPPYTRWFHRISFKKSPSIIESHDATWNGKYQELLVRILICTLLNSGWKYAFLLLWEFYTIYWSQVKLVRWKILKWHMFAVYQWSRTLHESTRHFKTLLHGKIEYLDTLDFTECKKKQYQPECHLFPATYTLWAINLLPERGKFSSPWRVQAETFYLPGSLDLRCY